MIAQHYSTRRTVVASLTMAMIDEVGPSQDSLLTERESTQDLLDRCQGILERGFLRNEQQSKTRNNDALLLLEVSNDQHPQRDCLNHQKLLSLLRIRSLLKRQADPKASELLEMMRFLLILQQQGMSILWIAHAVSRCFRTMIDFSDPQEEGGFPNYTSLYWMMEHEQGWEVMLSWCEGLEQVTTITSLPEIRHLLRQIYQLSDVLKQSHQGPPPRKKQRITLYESASRKDLWRRLPLSYLVCFVARECLLKQLDYQPFSLEQLDQEIQKLSSFRGFSDEGYTFFLFDIKTASCLRAEETHRCPTNLTMDDVIRRLQSYHFSAFQSLSQLNGRYSHEVLCARCAQIVQSIGRGNPKELLRAVPVFAYLSGIQPYQESYPSDGTLLDCMEHPFYPLLIHLDTFLQRSRTSLALELASEVEKCHNIHVMDKRLFYSYIFESLSRHESVFLKSVLGPHESPLLRQFLASAGKIGVETFACEYVRLPKEIDELLGLGAEREDVKKFVFMECRKSLILLLTTRYHPFDKGLEILHEYWPTDLPSGPERRKWAEDFLETEVQVPKELTLSGGFVSLSPIFEEMDRKARIVATQHKDVQPETVVLDSVAPDSGQRGKADFSEGEVSHQQNDSYESHADKEDNDLSSRAPSVSSRESSTRRQRGQFELLSDSGHSRMIDERIEQATTNKQSNTSKMDDSGYLAEYSQEDHTEEDEDRSGTAHPSSSMVALPRIDPGYIAEASHGEHTDDDERQRKDVLARIDSAFNDPGYKADYSQGDHTETEDEKPAEPTTSPIISRKKKAGIDTRRRVGFAADTFDSGYDAEGSQSYTEDEQKELAGYLAEGSQGENTEESEAFHTEDEDEDKKLQHSVSESMPAAMNPDYHGLSQNEIQKRLRDNDTNERDFQYSGDAESEESEGELMKAVSGLRDVQPLVGNQTIFGSQNIPDTFEQGTNHGNLSIPLTLIQSKTVGVTVNAVPFQGLKNGQGSAGYRTDDAVASQSSTIESESRSGVQVEDRAVQSPTRKLYIDDVSDQSESHDFSVDESEKIETKSTQSIRKTPSSPLRSRGNGGSKIDDVLSTPVTRSKSKIMEGRDLDPSEDPSTSSKTSPPIRRSGAKRGSGKATQDVPSTPLTRSAARQSAAKGVSRLQSSSQNVVASTAGLPPKPTRMKTRISKRNPVEEKNDTGEARSVSEKEMETPSRKGHENTDENALRRSPRLKRKRELESIAPKDRSSPGQTRSPRAVSISRKERGSPERNPSPSTRRSTRKSSKAQEAAMAVTSVGEREKQATRSTRKGNKRAIEDSDDVSTTAVSGTKKSASRPRIKKTDEGEATVQTEAVTPVRKSARRSKRNADEESEEKTKPSVSPKRRTTKKKKSDDSSTVSRRSATSAAGDSIASRTRRKTRSVNYK